ncbi:uncharacterized protein LOC110924641 [Helianthus annuus]|uniref:uncharacterized protein LOC110924641 n=1 Tax=Helianthus annuus TaxID=4232 RepID=UPI000B8EF313|nr:uncharacterized protein LOC110924641 [Helianthus annuus]
MVGWDPNVVDVMILSHSDQVIHTQIMFKLDRNREFKECVHDIEVFDLSRSGLQFTWTNNQKNRATILKKLDRVTGNVCLIDAFPATSAYFLPYCISDHSPCVLKLPNVTRDKPKPFKFVNLIADKSGFLDVVNSVWSRDIQGHRMFQLVNKLKLLKTPLRKLFFKQGNLHEKVNMTRKALEDCQKAIDSDPLIDVLKDQLDRLVHDYKEAVKDEGLFLKQKSKVEWLSLGDSNSKFFHNVIKAKNHRSRIFTIRDGGGILHEGGMVPQVLVDHYMDFFGNVGNTSMQPSPDLFRNVLVADKAAHMVRQITDDEIKLAMFSIAGNKSPGPDGYTLVFFKKAWDIVGNDSAFVPGRRITDNILLTQEIMHNYHRNQGPPKCAFKVDIQKAYNTVDWKFLERTLMGFGFHWKMVSWIMACVTSTSFYIAINTNLYGCFRGKCGLRQGDPMSPYLFTLVMELLTLILQKQVSLSNDFRFQHKYDKQRIINLCFVDDLFLFALGDHKSARVIIDAINDFKNVTLWDFPEHYLVCPGVYILIIK